MSRRRVVVTGMGMLSPLGTDVPSTWQGILAGRSGIGPIEHTDLSAYSTRFGGSVKGFEVEQYLSAKRGPQARPVHPVRPGGRVPGGA